MKNDDLPDIPIRITFADDPDPVWIRSDFSDESLEIIRRLHGSRVADMFLLPGPVPFGEVNARPCSSTTLSKLFTRLAGWRIRFGRKG